MCQPTGKVWEKFVAWAKLNGIEFRFPEEYERFWKCWFDATMSAGNDDSSEEKNG